MSASAGWARSVQENDGQVREWNRFVERLHAVHKALVRDHDIRTSEELGGYANDPDYYREISYFDAATDRLLSRIRWERENPDRIHVIELFFYDAKGRVARDYSAAYLTDFRNAPYQTLINVHRYNGDLRAFRQFDASGAALYEYCEGSLSGKPVAIAVDEPLTATPDGLTGSKPYIACFGIMPTTPGRFLDRTGGESKAESEHERGRRTDTNMRIAALGLKLRFAPDDAALYLERCRAYFAIQRFGKAIDDCARAIDIDARLDQAYFWRGMAFGRHGLLEKAIADFDVFIERQPENALAYTKRGVRHIWNGDMAAAKADLTRAIELDSTNAEAHDDLGVVYAQERDYDTAMKHFRASIRIEPDYQKAHHNLALVLHLLSRNADALTSIDRALQVGPHTRSSVLLKSSILDGLGRSDEAGRLRAKAETMPQKNWSENLAIR